jgi:hypothetical protein
MIGLFQGFEKYLLKSERNEPMFMDVIIWISDSKQKKGI